MSSKVLIMAGGTGGHVYPALTIARELLSRGVQVEWLGTRAGLEARVIGESSIPLHYISIGGLRGKSLLRLVLAPFTITRALVQALLHLRRIRPDCVLGMGGFVTGPGGLAAWLTGRALVLHEQNAIAGLSNQLLYPFANVVMEGFEGAFKRKQQLSQGHFWKRLMAPEKRRVTGNPVRQEILQLPGAKARAATHEGRLRLLVLGGSLGAVAINDCVPAMLAQLPAGGRPLVRHQCGAKNLKATQEGYRTAGIAIDASVQVVPYIEDMAEAYDWADLVVCRAGASTVAELAVAGLPAILVPYPWAVDDHQRANARVLEEAGAAWLLSQDALTPAALAAIIAPLLADRSGLETRARAAARVAVREATQLAADICQEACHV